jgi:type IV fimbrial biogenesis protein FimT
MLGATRRRRERGFTLIELMIVVVILAILLAVAGPSFFDSLTRNQVRTQTSLVVSSLNLARSKAVERNHPVSICTSTYSTAQANPICDGALTLNDGWVIFLDAAEDGVSAADEVVKAIEGLPDDFTIKNAVFPITFYPDGSASTSTGANPMYFCPPDNDAQKTWSVVLEATGRPQMVGPDGNAANVCS